MLDLKVDSSFAGVNVNVNAKTNTSEQTFIHATTLEQDYFTVKLKDTWLQDPSTLFDKSVTTEQLRKAMNGKALAIVTSVTYGRTFSYLREYSAKAVKVDSSQKVSAYGTNVDASENYSSSESYQNSEIFNLGGTSLSKSVLEGKKTQEEIEKAMANNMQFSRNNQGVVTKYTIQLVTSTTPGKPIRPLFNGKLYQIGYVRCPRKLSAYVNVGPVRIGGSGGGDVRVFLEVQCFRVVNGKPVIFKTVDMHSPRKIVWDWYYTCNKTATHIYGDLNEGEYIFKNPTLRVQSRASKVSDWTTDDTKLLNHGEIESGEIELYLDGDVCSSVKIIEIKS
jgi:thiol-activated cytolysin